MTDEGRLIDTNVLVHAYVLIEPAKNTRARALLRQIWKHGSGVTSVQNLCEFVVVVTRKVERPMSLTRAKSIVSTILHSPKWNVIDRDSGTLPKAIDLVSRYRIPFWDALIAASMIEHNIRIVVTENERDFKKVRGLKVINPFAS